ncbi:MAG: hypothetical protein H6735_32490 [Alphaproteobacteria bacterium]|nr:hypothetical protein [Alphaproteobacteria bacterium]
MDTRDLELAVAGPDDDAGLRGLMRATPMDGSVSLAFAREPDFFRAARVEGDTTTVLARDPEGSVVAAFSWSVRPCWVGGEPRPLGYLSALRVVPAWRGRPSLLRLGYARVRELMAATAADGGQPYAITTIVSDNAPARRLLERGLPGLPRYVPQQEMVTLAAPTWRRRYRAVTGLEVRDATDADLDAIVGLLAAEGRRSAFTPQWSADTLRDADRCRDLHVGDFVVATRGGRMVGCVALWDQSAYKQSVVHGYRGHLARTRRVVNLLAPVLGVPRLPRPGEPLRHAYLSHLAIADDDEQVARAVVGFAHDRARPRRYGYLTTMLASSHPLLPVLERMLRPLRYPSMLYAVAWEDADLSGLPGERPHLEVAVL